MVQISILLNKSNLNEILHISGNIESTKKADHIWKWQDKGNFVIIISRNLLLKLGWQKNAANYIKNQDDIQVVLHTVMFRGTPCTLYSQSVPLKDASWVYNSRLYCLFVRRKHDMYIKERSPWKPSPWNAQISQDQGRGGGWVLIAPPLKTPLLD